MKNVASMLVGLVLFPASALAAVMDGTVVKVDKDKKEITLKTDRGQETVAFTSSTKGAENAMEGTRITINYKQNGEKLVASEIEVNKADPKTSLPKGVTADPKPLPSDKPSLPPIEPR
jgi:hypothetical protein